MFIVVQRAIIIMNTRNTFSQNLVNRIIVDSQHTHNHQCFESNIFFFLDSIIVSLRVCVCVYTSIIMIKKNVYLFIYSFIYLLIMIASCSGSVCRQILNKMKLRNECFYFEKNTIHHFRRKFLLFFVPFIFIFFHRKFFFHITKRYSNNS